MSAAPAAVARHTGTAHQQRSGSPQLSPQRSPQLSPQPSPQRHAPPLRVVRGRTTPARAPFVLLVAGLLATGLVTVLLVNTWLAQGSFTLRQLQQQQGQLQVQTQALRQKIEAESAPGALAEHAAALGMVPAPNPVFKKPNGQVLGVAVPGVRPAPPPPPPTPSVAPSPSATPTPTAAATVGATAGVMAPAKPTGTGTAGSASTAGSSAKPSTPAASGGHG